MTYELSAAQANAYATVRSRIGPTKHCNPCDAEHPVEEFAFKSVASAKLQSRCRTAQGNASRDWYAANGDSHRSAVVARNASRAGDVNELVDTWLADKICEGCGAPAAIAVDAGANLRRQLRDGPSPADGADAFARAVAVCRSCRQR